MESSLPVAERPRRPEWMKVRAPSKDGSYFDVQKLVHGLSLHTICEEARCPNISECWGRGTATFQILGDTCTRACRYCYVNSGKPSEPVDPLEPLRLAQAAKQIDDELGPSYELLQVQTNPIAIKAALNLLGHHVGGLRLPLVEATDDEVARVRGCLERLGVLARAHQSRDRLKAGKLSRAPAALAGDELI